MLSSSNCADHQEEGSWTVFPSGLPVGFAHRENTGCQSGPEAEEVLSARGPQTPLLLLLLLLTPPKAGHPKTSLSRASSFIPRHQLLGQERVGGRSVAGRVVVVVVSLPCSLASLWPASCPLPGHPPAFCFGTRI